MLWQYIWSAVVHLLNMITMGGLAWHAFRQSERIKSLTKQANERASYAAIRRDELMEKQVEMITKAAYHLETITERK